MVQSRFAIPALALLLSLVAACGGPSQQSVAVTDVAMSVTPASSAELPPLVTPLSAERDAPPPPADDGLFGAKHLVVMYAGSRRAPPSVTRTKDEARSRAEEALVKIHSGARFEDVVAQYSDEPSAGARGGDLGRFKRGTMDPSFQDAVESVHVGEVSGIVETPFGFHVILRTK